MNLGVKRHEAERFEEHIREGQTILAVQAAHDVEVAIAWHIFAHCHSDEIAIVGAPRAAAAELATEPVLATSWAAAAA